MNKRFFLNRILFAVCFMAVLCLGGVFAHTIKAHASVSIPAYIDAVYTGEAGLVGSEINREDLSVQAVYDDGSVVDRADIKRRRK